MIDYLLFGIALFSALVLYVYEGVLTFMAARLWLRTGRDGLSSRRIIPPLPKDDVLPRLLMQIPLYNERYVIEDLFNALAALSYPADKLTIQILDDSTDDTPGIVQANMSKLEARGFKAVHVRRENRQGYKAGALAEGMLLDDSPFIAIFDADFVPQPNILRQLWAEFDGKDMGLVQAGWDHINGKENVATRLMSLAIDDHFSIEQQGRQELGAWIHFNGTAGMWRREAIVTSGGWQSDTLTEDLDLSFRAQARGWRLKFVDDLKVPCLIPSVMSAIRTQQHRWTKGAAETARKNAGHMLAKKAPFVIRVIDLFHVFNFLMFPAMLLMSLSVALLPLLGFGQTAAYSTLIGILYPLLPLSLLPFFVAGILRARREGKVNPFIVANDTFMLLLMIMGLAMQNTLSVIDGLIGRKSSFVRTPKPPRGQSIGALAQSYKHKLSLKVMVLEGAMVALMLAFMIYAAINLNFFVVLTALYFFLCYAMVIALSLIEIRQETNAAAKAALA
ncbi:glycosyltransferase family 2 protein [Aestuariivirga litoralis]|uniref:glycosyltransferase family 2 protein n=1 Tax=Aestuariivirga litoralis TaxID=2650924 RepID=UPI0018C71D54|nr:glycosyltransferase family 2 protein [Aestuariivirga litoralis]MBG1232432.1 glycosyltransferase [Aestuariivirga litoralis]